MLNDVSRILKITLSYIDQELEDKMPTLKINKREINYEELKEKIRGKLEEQLQNQHKNNFDEHSDLDESDNEENDKSKLWITIRIMTLLT